MSKKIVKPESEWKAQLSPLSFEVTRQKGTERAFSGQYWNHLEQGVYRCVCCGEALFASDTKFESGCGWPSYFLPIDSAHIEEHLDTTHGMVRTEVTCAKCDAHLGHVFDDGPEPSGLRYCINSVSLTFEPTSSN